MVSYRVRRRAFLASLGGAVGFSSLLSKLEAAAEGAAAPPRFLLMFWPVGTVPYRFVPQGSGRNYVTSPILQPFEAAGLRDEMTVLYGLRDVNRTAGGGGSEAGVVFRTTCADSPGTRQNGGEGDDAVAGGPSIDQILLKRAPALATAFGTAVNVSCDARVDSNETSAACLSYSYATRDIDSATPGGKITEHVPLLPILKPATLYASLFSGFMPGGGDKTQTVTQALKLRKSVLDYSLGELKRLNDIAPSSEREKLEIHADSIRKAEIQLSAAGGVDSSACQVPAAPDATLAARVGSHIDYGNAVAQEADNDLLAELGKQHLAVIRAAFQCDITRVATFQWAPATDHVAFKGLYPGEPDTIYLHHPLSHRVTGPVRVEPPAGPTHDDLEFLANVHTWFNARTAEALAALKTTRDIFGEPLLDHTIVPFVTDTADASHARSRLPALLFGGRALGMQGGQFIDYSAGPRPFGDVWLTVAQAYLQGMDVKAALADEVFLQQYANYTPLAGVWEAPK